MGKNKPAKPVKSKRKAASGDLTPYLVTGALLVAVVAYGAYTVLTPSAAATPGATASADRRGATTRAGAAQGQTRPKRELTPFEMRQQGRKPPGSDRPRCVDGRGCGDMTEASCEDPLIAKRCCLSCFKKACVDHDPSCIDRAQHGACYLEPEYMNATCCFACSPDPEDRCSPDPRKRPDVAEGDLSKTFQRAIDKYPQYGPRVYSRDPWVVGFDHLLTDEECDGVIEAVGGKHGEYLKPSTTAQAVRENGRMVLKDVPDQIRTSWNGWCQHEGCYNHPIHERVITRIMDIVGLPHDHAEHMQLLKYGPGEYYRLHHDWIPEQVQALCGPRVFTFFLYLSDVEEGGGTQFPYLKDENGAPITVQARKGTAVWWPHGLESNPWQKDDRTHHEAMPVIVGKKMAANYWIHGSDFKGSMAAGCDGRSGVSGRVWRK